MTESEQPFEGAYGYNARSELVSSARTGGAPSPATEHEYAYDPIGNRTSSAVYDGNGVAVGSAYAANPLNQYILKTVPEAAFTYDDDGNMTSDGTFTYAWNGENRMVSASNGQMTVAYSYDDQGRMVRKAVAHGNAGVRAVTFVWDGYNIIRERVLSNDVPSVTENIWGLDLDGTVQGAGGVGGLLAVLRDGSAFLAAYDANGNVAEYVAAADGSVAAHYGYTPFGGIAAQSGALADTFTQRFSTKPWCGVTGLCEYQFRKYSPELGRWMSLDPYTDMAFQTQISVTRDPFIVSHVHSVAHTPLDLNPLLFVVDNPVSAYDFLGFADCVYNETLGYCARNIPPEKRKEGWNKPNGCGGVEWWENVPEDPSFWREIIKLDFPINCTFTPSCNNHDKCYWTCNSDRKECDRRFLVDMIFQCSQCRNNSFQRSSLRGWIWFKGCVENALVYYSGVRSGGWHDFKKYSQPESCEPCCCD